MDIKLLLQIAGVLLGLLYLWLEYRADIRLWIVGLVMLRGYQHEDFGRITQSVKQDRP